jgi:hypothetical protein
MINLVSLNTKEITPRHITAQNYARHCGMLTSPRNRKNPHEAIALGARWAADNDCFVEFAPRRIIEWLQQYRAIAHTCLWFNAPDVVQNADATLFNFWIWQPIIQAYGFKVAFTLQNGMERHQVPWQYCAAVFIGGSDAFKYSDYVHETVREANKRGIWVHQGRCNSIQRINYSQAIGCDSFDGTGYKWGVNTIKHMPYLVHKQLALPIKE